MRDVNTRLHPSAPVPPPRTVQPRGSQRPTRLALKIQVHDVRCVSQTNFLSRRCAIHRNSRIPRECPGYAPCSGTPDTTLAGVRATSRSVAPPRVRHRVRKSSPEPRCQGVAPADRKILHRPCKSVQRHALGLKSLRHTRRKCRVKIGAMGALIGGRLRVRPAPFGVIGICSSPIGRTRLQNAWQLPIAADADVDKTIGGRHHAHRSRCGWSLPALAAPCLRSIRAPRSPSSRYLGLQSEVCTHWPRPDFYARPRRRGCGRGKDEA